MTKGASPQRGAARRGEGASRTKQHTLSIPFSSSLCASLLGKFYPWLKSETVARLYNFKHTQI